MGEMYLHTRMFCALAHMSSIPMGAMPELQTVLSPCNQTGFVTVDDFVALFTCSYVFYSHGCNEFLHARTFFTLADTITPIFTMLTEVWPRANRAMVTNN